MKTYAWHNYDNVTTKWVNAKQQVQISARKVPGVPAAPLDQTDAHAFVVPPGGAVGHKNGWLSPSPPQTPGDFS